MGSRGRRALLGRIAEFGWFTQQGEPAATQALAMILEDAPVRAAFVGYLEQLTQTDLSAVSYFVPENVHQDGGRPDIEGLDDSGQPLIVMEAKFGAILESGQVRSYLADQASRLDAEIPGIFILLVPTARIAEAKHVLDGAHVVGSLARSAQRNQVVSWDDCIKVCEDAIRSLPDGADIAGDLVQFRAMCTTLGGMVIAPLGSVTVGDEWRERESDLRQLVRDATEHFVPLGARFPMASEVGYEHRRYIPGGTSAEGVCCSVGIATRFADERNTPFWLRYHRLTPGFRVVQAHLSRSRYKPEIRTDGRHIWVPLDAHPDAAGPELVQGLIAQVSDIISTASTE